jgi:chromosome segregation ATPase
LCSEILRRVAAQNEVPSSSTKTLEEMRSELHEQYTSMTQLKKTMDDFQSHLMAINKQGKQNEKVLKSVNAIFGNEKAEWFEKHEELVHSIESKIKDFKISVNSDLEDVLNTFNEDLKQANDTAKICFDMSYKAEQKLQTVDDRFNNMIDIEKNVGEMKERLTELNAKDWTSPNLDAFKNQIKEDLSNDIMDLRKDLAGDLADFSEKLDEKESEVKDFHKAIGDCVGKVVDSTFQMDRVRDEIDHVKDVIGELTVTTRALKEDQDAASSALKALKDNPDTISYIDRFGAKFIFHTAPPARGGGLIFF